MTVRYNELECDFNMIPVMISPERAWLNTPLRYPLAGTAFAGIQDLVDNEPVSPVQNSPDITVFRKYSPRDPAEPPIHLHR